MERSDFPSGAERLYSGGGGRVIEFNNYYQTLFWKDLVFGFHKNLVYECCESAQIYSPCTLQGAIALKTGSDKLL